MDSEIPPHCRHSFHWLYPIARKHCERARRYRQRTHDLRRELSTLRAAYRSLRIQYEQLKLEILQTMSKPFLVEEPAIGIQEAGVESDDSYITLNSVEDEEHD